MKKIISGLSLMIFVVCVGVAAAADAESMFRSSCAACHGSQGDKIDPALNTQAPDMILTKLNGYGDGSFGGEKKAVMVNVVKKHNADDLKTIADFIGKK